MPERWPAGDPPRYVEAYPSLLKGSTGEQLEPYFSWAAAKRPAEELYDLRFDPDQLYNLAARPYYQDMLLSFRKRLFLEQVLSEDPIFDEVSYFDQF